MSIRIGNGAGFGGDNLDAARLLAESGDLDYLTLEYLAELTLSILAYQKSRDLDAGYVQDLPKVVEALCDAFRQQPNLKLVTNGGGMNPATCVENVADILCRNGLDQMRVACCEGDDLLDRMDELTSKGETFAHLDSGEPLGNRIESITSANVYLGAEGVVQALHNKAQVIVTGRVADAALVMGPAVHEFQWGWSDYAQLGKAAVAGHLIECGAQVTGGMYSNWRANANIALDLVGYPIAELSESGDCLITKPAGSDGIVNCETVAEQLVYEIGDPGNYLTPDVVADFSDVTLRQEAANRVGVSGGTGKAAPDRYKVSLSYHDGFAVSGMIVFCGPNAIENARAGAAMLQSRLRLAGYDLDRFESEVLGAGDTFAGDSSSTDGLKAKLQSQPWEVVLRVAAQDSRREAVDRLARELAPLVTSGPPGVTGYTGRRAKSRPVFAFWPTTISREHVKHVVEVKSAQSWTEIEFDDRR